MPSNQNPVYTDSTLSGDGTIADPLSAGAAVAAIPQNFIFTNQNAPIAVPGDASDVNLFTESVTTPDFPSGSTACLILASFEFDAGAATGSLDVIIGLGATTITETVTLAASEKKIITILKTVNPGTGLTANVTVDLEYTSADPGAVNGEPNLAFTAFQA